MAVLRQAIARELAERQASLNHLENQFRTSRGRRDIARGLGVGLGLGFAAGLAFGCAAGITAGLSYGLAFGLAGELAREPGTSLAARAVISSDALFGLKFGSEFGFPVGLVGGLAYGLGLAGAAQASRRYVVFLMCSRRRLPVRLGLFLDWAVTAGLLRYSGHAYQYRHRELQQLRPPTPCPCPEGTTNREEVEGGARVRAVRAGSLPCAPGVSTGPLAWASPHCHRRWPCRYSS